MGSPADVWRAGNWRPVLPYCPGSIEDGALVADKNPNKEASHLVSKEKYRNFHIYAEFAEVDPMPKAGGKWNTYEITAKGRRITVALNGYKTADLNNGMFVEGPITLQHGTGVIKFRKVAIKAL
jgi:hypothetical protein